MDVSSRGSFSHGHVMSCPTSYMLKYTKGLWHALHAFLQALHRHAAAYTQGLTSTQAQTWPALHDNADYSTPAQHDAIAHTLRHCCSSQRPAPPRASKCGQDAVCRAVLSDAHERRIVWAARQRLAQAGRLPAAHTLADSATLWWQQPTNPGKTESKSRR